MKEDRDVDERLRTLFEPERNAVERLVAATLEPAPGPCAAESRDDAFLLWQVPAFSLA